MEAVDVMGAETKANFIPCSSYSRTAIYLAET
jgi:hypothetical protein